MNVFDLVNDFYQQDEEWDNIIPRAQVENFLRSLSWKGMEDKELTAVWENITLFCVYLGNSENFLGSMNREDFIDCVGWCARNVADFSVEGKHISSFLETLADFYLHLAKKHLVHDTKAPLEARDKLLVAGVVQILDAKGNFLPDFDRHNQYNTPDLPAKIFLNVGEKMDKLMTAVQKFFEKPRFDGDFRKASYLYGGMELSAKSADVPEWDEFNQGFWDYFLFDYHLMDVDKTPLQYFRDKIDQMKNSAELSRDVLDELLKAHLVLFTVEGPGMDETYNCVDFLSGENYTLCLPIEKGTETDKMIFMGHIFYDDTMVVNFMKGVRLMGNSRKHLEKILRRGKQWYGIRAGGQGDWRSFISRNALFVRQAMSFVSSHIRTAKFDQPSMVKNYFPHKPEPDDEVALLLAKFMKSYSFAAHDVELAQTMWGDFLEKSGKKIRVPESWAAGVLYCFVVLNKVYNYDLSEISQMCRFVPLNSISRCSREIRNVLALEPSDPRYVSEEGMLALLVDIDF